MIFRLQIVLLLFQDVFTNNIENSMRFSTPPLYDAVASLTDEENFIISPLSINMVMSMLYIGTQEGSDSDIQLKNAFRFENKAQNSLLPSVKKIVSDLENYSTDNTTILLANALFKSDSNVDLKWNFEIHMKNNFRASIESVNFWRKDIAVKQINDWVANKTRNLIPELVSGSSINEDTKLILTNAIYFKSKVFHLKDSLFSINN